MLELVKEISNKSIFERYIEKIQSDRLNESKNFIREEGGK